MNSYIRATSRLNREKREVVFLIDDKSYLWDCCKLLLHAAYYWLSFPEYENVRRTAAVSEESDLWKNKFHFIRAVLFLLLRHRSKTSADFWVARFILITSDLTSAACGGARCFYHSA